MTAQFQYCEDCRKWKRSAHRRADTRRVQCADCYSKTLRHNSPTGLVSVPAYLQRGASDEPRDN